MGFKTVKRGVRRYGFAGAAKRAAARVGSRFYLREEHHWYELNLESERPRKPVPEGFRLVQATDKELPLLAKLPTVKLKEGERRIGSGATLWFLLDGEEPAFACWTFYNRMPVYAAKGGVLELPHRTAGLEDSVTSPDYRGRGLAPGAWTAISDHLVTAGFDKLITKVAEENVPSRKAVQKAGFEDVSVMRLIRVGPRRKVEVEPVASDVAAYLQGELASHPG